jgi:hypothetical protein
MYTSNNFKKLLLNLRNSESCAKKKKILFQPFDLLEKNWIFFKIRNKILIFFSKETHSKVPFRGEEKKLFYKYFNLEGSFFFTLLQKSVTGSCSKL